MHASRRHGKVNATWPVGSSQYCPSTTSRGGLTEKGSYIFVVLMREFFTGINTLREQMKHSKPTAGPDD